MTNEATIRASLAVIQGNVNFRSNPQSFTADVTGSAGPGPGLVSATAAGVDIDLSAFTTPAFCVLRNLDQTNFVEYGIWDGVSFYPLGEIQPGEFYIIRLARNLTREYGTGTGTTGTAINRLRVKTNNNSSAAANVVAEVFET